MVRFADTFGPEYLGRQEDYRPTTQSDTSSTRRFHYVLSRPGLLFTDFLSISVTMGLLGFVCFIATLNNRDLDSRYSGFETALLTLGPLFPMIFAFVMGRFLYYLAQNRLERGVTLGTLEQLMGSHTLGSAFKTHFELRLFNVASFFLLSGWLLSPLGGQAFPRLLSQGTRITETDMTYRDMKRSTQSRAVFVEQGYFASLFSPLQIKQSPQDVWGNVKIPLVDHNDTTTTSTDEGGWVEVHDSGGGTLHYTSLLGMPINNVTDGNITFSLETTHIDLSCQPMTFDDGPLPTGPTNNSFAKLETKLTPIALSDPMPNGTWYGRHQDEWWQPANVRIWWTLAVDQFVHPSWRGTATQEYFNLFPNDPDLEVNPARLLFQARTILEDGARVGLYKTECGALQKYVESRVRCTQAPHATSRSCRVVSQRPSRTPHPPETLSMLSFPMSTHSLSMLLPRYLTEGVVSAGDPTLFHISDPAMKGYATSATIPDLSQMATNDFARGLSQVINTYLTYVRFSESLFTDSWEPNLNVTEISGFPSLTTTAEVSHLTYRINWPWMAVCLASSVVLAAAGVMGTWFAHEARGPEILGFTSSILRDSRYVDMALSGQKDHLNGDELSRALSKERVQYGYIQQHGPTKPPRLGIGREGNVDGIRDRLT